MPSRTSWNHEGSGMHDYYLTEYAIALQDCPDVELAEAYAQYVDSPGSMYFAEIFWEANRRGLSLDDLEEIYINDNPPLI